MYRPLPLSRLNCRVTYHRPTQQFSSQPSMDTPAFAVMTDLGKVTTITIGALETVAAANDRMIAHGVRLLLVTDPHEMIQGLITATDILGEKPLNYLRSVGGHHGEILVQDIMTPFDELEVLQLADVAAASVGDVVATLKEVGRQHALVVDGLENLSAPRLRGIFSSTHIGSLLGETVDVYGKAGSFAELEMALIHGH